MSSDITGDNGGPGDEVIRQLSDATRVKRGDIIDVADLKRAENRESTTIIERIAEFRRGYRAWISRQADAIIKKEPAIDREAEASWRSR